MDLAYFGIDRETENWEELQDRVDIIIHKLKFFPERPKVALIRNLSPVQLPDNHLNKSLEIAGGFPVSSLQELPLADIVIFAPSQQDIESATKQVSSLIEELSALNSNALKDNRVYIADAENYLDKEGVAAIEALEMLAEIITPRYFNFGFENRGWLKFEL